MECVKCGAELSDSEVECPNCGVIVSKARATPPPRDPALGSEGSVPSPGHRKYHYLVTPFHGRIRAGQGIQEVSSQLQDPINHYAAYGWEFVQVGSGRKRKPHGERGVPCGLLRARQFPAFVRPGRLSSSSRR